MNCGVENQAPVEPLNKFHLNVYPGGGYKGNGSLWGKKNSEGSILEVVGLFLSRKSQWLQGDPRQGV